MFFTIAAATLAALSQVATGTPLAASTNAIQPIAAGVTTAAHFPVHELGSVAATAKVTLAGAGPHTEAAEAPFPATLLLCPTFNCASCFSFDLSTIPIDECFLDTSSSFNSVAIVQPSNEGLPFGVATGLNQCATLSVIPFVNACFNINGGPFTDFALLQ